MSKVLNGINDKEGEFLDKGMIKGSRERRPEQSPTQAMLEG